MVSHLVGFFLLLVGGAAVSAESYAIAVFCAFFGLILMLFS